MNKKGASFGTIVAIIGAILVFCGVAWLIAQNWHQMDDFLKILVLVIAVISSYIFGVILYNNDYPGIAKALFALGALLYTLSIFLIAQIFATNVALQGTAWLLLIAWVGVIISAYVFESSISLVIGLVEFMIWIFIQMRAFLEFNNQLSIGLYAVCFLVIGFLFYGISLIHRANEQKFSELYRLWTSIYFLLFAYILSFQTFLPKIWNEGFTTPDSLLFFLIFIAFLGITFFIIGLIVAKENDAITNKEILGIISIIILLGIMLFSAGLVSGIVGTCDAKTCYDLNTKTSCLEFGSCNWTVMGTESRCEEIYQDCYNFKNSLSCEQNSLCKWQNNSEGERCLTASCYEYNNKLECEKALKPKCLWQKENGFRSGPREYCVEYQKALCSNYNNDKENCLDNNLCSWRSTDSIYRGQVPTLLWAIWIINNILLILIILITIG